jgi:hypothetical protein
MQAPSPQSANYVTNGARVLKRKSTIHSGVDEVVRLARAKHPSTRRVLVWYVLT